MRLLPSYCCMPLPLSAGNEAGGRLGMRQGKAGNSQGAVFHKRCWTM